MYVRNTNDAMNMQPHCPANDVWGEDEPKSWLDH